MHKSNHLKKPITATEALARRNDLKSIISSDVLILLDVNIAILSHLENKPKRKPSEYNKFFAKEMRKGTPMSEIGAKWRAKK